MAERYKLEAQKREQIGSSQARRARRAGLIPAVVYGKNEPSVHVQVLKTALLKALSTDLGENVIIDLSVANGKGALAKTVIIKEIQHDPVTGSVQHVDFDHISLSQKITVKVPVAVKGDAVGVAQQGGVLERVLWELEIECLPTQIPEHIEVDCSALELGHALHVKDLKIDPNLKILQEPDAVVVAVMAPEKEKEPEAEEAAAETAEPEVIAKGKKEEDSEGAPDEAKPAQPEEKKG